jgi:hypothetical protein
VQFNGQQLQHYQDSILVHTEVSLPSEAQAECTCTAAWPVSKPMLCCCLCRMGR